MSYDRRRIRGHHPAACTCTACEETRLARQGTKSGGQVAVGRSGRECKGKGRVPAVGRPETIRCPMCFGMGTVHDTEVALRRREIEIRREEASKEAVRRAAQEAEAAARQAKQEAELVPHVWEPRASPVSHNSDDQYRLPRRSRRGIRPGRLLLLGVVIAAIGGIWYVMMGDMGRAMIDWVDSVTIEPNAPLGPEDASAAAPSASRTSLQYVAGAALHAGEVERWVIEFTNHERTSRGLSPLFHDPAISDIARAHSEGMAELGVFSHRIGGDGPTDRALDAGYDCRANLGGGRQSYGLAENIAKTPRVQRWRWNTNSGWRPVRYHADSEAMAKAIVQQWMGSPGHRANILKPSYRRIGVGIHAQESRKYGYQDEMVFATQNFSSCRAPRN